MMKALGVAGEAAFVIVCAALMCMVLPFYLAFHWLGGGLMDQMETTRERMRRRMRDFD
jgi:hypothetical protein